MAQIYNASSAYVVDNNKNKIKVSDRNEVQNLKQQNNSLQNNEWIDCGYIGYGEGKVLFHYDSGYGEVIGQIGLTEMWSTYMYFYIPNGYKFVNNNVNLPFGRDKGMQSGHAQLAGGNAVHIYYQSLNEGIHLKFPCRKI